MHLGAANHMHLGGLRSHRDSLELHEAMLQLKDLGLLLLVQCKQVRDHFIALVPIALSHH